MLRLYHRSAFMRVAQISFGISSQGFAKTPTADPNCTGTLVLAADLW